MSGVATNGQRKIFTLAPAQDEMTAVILQTRRECLTDPDLSLGAKVLFCILLDWSLWPGKNKGPGVVTISTTKLAELISCSRRAVYDWKHELILKRLIWITDWFIPNAWPIHTYHITAICPEEHGGDLATSDGLWGNGYRRPQAERGLGARKAASVANFAQEKTADSSFLPENATGNGKKPHAPVAPFATGNGKICDGEPQNMRLATAKSALGNRKKQHRATAKNSTRPSQKPAHLIEGECTEERGLRTREEGKNGSPAPESTMEAAFKAWEVRLDDMRNSDLRKLENIASREFQEARSDSARQNAKRKLVAIRLRLRGPAVADEPAPRPRPVRKAPELSEVEILTAARQILADSKESGIKPILTDKHKAALRKAGEL